MADDGGKNDVLSPAVRRRLQQQYERGRQNTASGNFDYADDLLTSAVVGDPANQFYTEAFLDNLHRKYSSGKKGGIFSSLFAKGSAAPSKTSMMNANRKKDWLGLIRSGMDALKANPYDTATLLQMAKACSEKGYVESQLIYLKTCQTIDPKSFEIQRECAIALEKSGPVRRGDCLLVESRKARCSLQRTSAGSA